MQLQKHATAATWERPPYTRVVVGRRLISVSPTPHKVQALHQAPGGSAPSRIHSSLRPLTDEESMTYSRDDDEEPDALNDRILSGKYTVTSGSKKERLTRPLRELLALDKTGPGRWLALQLANLGRSWRARAAGRLPEARGDIREIVGQPVFVPLYKLFTVYGKIFRLSFGPKSFVVISDPAYAKQILLTNAERYSKGILSEILEFVMGTGLIPADGEVWKIRRRAIVPALHKKYVASMVTMFGDCTLHGCSTLDKAAAAGTSLDMENYFSRLALDIIGKAVFNYDFDSLTHDDPVIKAVYTVLREAEHRSVQPLPYWNLPFAKQLIPRQKRCVEALAVVNASLTELIAASKKLVEEEDAEFVEEFLSAADPSILHFLLASGDEINSKQLRDDLMTMLIAGHETTAAVLTWTFYLLAEHPDIMARLRAEVDEVLGDRIPGVADMRSLKFTTRVINEAMRLYPQPPVLIRRALQADTFDQYTIPAGSDLFISVWNLHRSPALWSSPEAFDPDRFGPLDGPIPNEVTESFAYLPFGGGRRKCIGDQFALFESIVALAMLSRRYEFELDPKGPPVGMTTGATIHTTAGLFMNVKPRAVASADRTSPCATVGSSSADGDSPCPVAIPTYSTLSISQTDVTPVDISGASSSSSSASNGSSGGGTSRNGNGISHSSSTANGTGNGNGHVAGSGGSPAEKVEASALSSNGHSGSNGSNGSGSSAEVAEADSAKEKEMVSASHGKKQ